MTKKLEELQSEHLECRTFGHAWYYAGNEGTKRSRRDGGVLLVMLVKCKRCTTEKREAVRFTTGEVASRSYGYVEGYTLDRSKRKRKVTRADARLVFVRGIR